MTPVPISSSEVLAVDPEYAHRPTLCQVLCNNSPPPYTRSAFSIFLSQNFCSEVLAFTADVVIYRNTYSQLQAFRASKPFCGSEHEHEMLVARTWALWRGIIDTYICNNSSREINIPGAEREALLKLAGARGDREEPHSPDVLQGAYDNMYDLLGGVFVQFVESVEARENEKRCCNEVSHPCGDYRTAMPLSSDDELPRHRRAHGLWGSTRVYRKIMFPTKLRRKGRMTLSSLERE